MFSDGLPVAEGRLKSVRRAAGLIELQHGGGVDVLHVVEVFQRVDELLHFRRVFASEHGFVLRAHGYVAVLRFEARRFEFGFHARPVGGGGADFDDAFFVGEHIFRARFERGFHQRVFVGVGEHQIALVDEVEGHAAVGAQIAAVFAERVAHVGHGTGFVVGHAVHHQGRAADAVAFVAQLDVFRAFHVARAFVDGALHVVFGHVRVPSLVHRQAQARVGIGVAAAQTRGNGDFLDQTGEDFAALGVGAGFFVLDVRPLAVACHIGILIYVFRRPPNRCRLRLGKNKGAILT